MIQIVFEIKQGFIPLGYKTILHRIMEIYQPNNIRWLLKWKTSNTNKR